MTFDFTPQTPDLDFPLFESTDLFGKEVRYPSPMMDFPIDDKNVDWGVFYPTPEEEPLAAFEASEYSSGTPLFEEVGQFEESVDPAVLHSEGDGLGLALFSSMDATSSAMDTPSDTIRVSLPDLAVLLSNLVRPVPAAEASLEGLSPARSKIRRRPSKIYPCPIPGCPKSFTRKFNLQTHLRTHDPARARPFECPECKKTFLRVHDLERHETVHSKIKAHVCPGEGCLKRFTRADALRRHLKTSKCVDPND
ncbi:uncharacterized protein SPPG_03733 [Spizellomyces punctatus DAOM BR117]|uniref:C2H2-type domain-containing protein n=1 Tax=Spizellomyces punctatus (strain DAOM BR117) TaxID=645134 RepID=A0A0L0HGM4_SPIPD|nr:uncharacterized protein SPPG_03733 [Spizellomyces punctatus DAOM BR117]KND00606.1 hypothetical protein SPPG_03733 [Spizellomyces punctatus DAOM BR117]|eukprot:XP_016608645.1 hypothetical protein SPPG_03733 [Spizellomyces punctatus DAOM BR117]